jgi:hypothetical protein
MRYVVFETHAVYEAITKNTAGPLHFRKNFCEAGKAVKF